MGRKHTIEFVRESFNGEGYSLISTEYTHSKQILDYVCPNGHTHFVRWNDWQQGKRCFYCSTNVGASYTTIKKSFEDEGYILLSKEYKNNRTKLDYICPNNHQHSVTWGHWSSSNSRCPYCLGYGRYTIVDVEDLAGSIGYTLLSPTYSTLTTKMGFICNKGHMISMSFDSLRQGHRCSECMRNKKHDIDLIRGELSTEGYVLLTKKYINNKQKLVCICSRGHKCKIMFGGWCSGRRCPVCKGINLSINRTGTGHPNWQGGVSFEPYCEAWKDQEYKQDIKNRDGNICLNPYCYGTDTVLSIHHIDYNKKNCAPSNLITVCRSCNSKANYNRTWHTSWYQAILNRRYGYEYRKF